MFIIRNSRGETVFRFFVYVKVVLVLVCLAGSQAKVCYTLNNKPTAWAACDIDHFCVSLTRRPKVYQ